MQQYMAAKAAHPEALVLFRMGDFYELFYEDAVTASRELQIQLTARDKERTVPMCGVPYHAAENYIQRLLRKGYRVALCEQMEDPKLTKKIVRREVTRVLTPGTAMDPGLGQEQNNFLAAAFEAENGVVGLALLDLSTGEFRAAEFGGLGNNADAARGLAIRGLAIRGLAIEELWKAAPSEVLVATGAGDGWMADMERLRDRVRTVTRVEDWVWKADYALPLVERQLGVRTLEGFGLSDHPAAAIAAGAALHYVRSTQGLDATHIDSLRFVEHAGALQLDGVTVRNLELVEPLYAGGAGAETKVTLFHTLDACLTPMGKRLLRATILRPLFDRAAIEARYEAVGEAADDLLRRDGLRQTLGGMFDLERLLGRLALDSAGPRDMRAMAGSLARLPGLRRALAEMTTGLWREVTGRLDAELGALAALAAKVEATLVAEPPLTLADGGVIAPGVDAELDQLRTIGGDGRQAIAAIEERERARTGIASLKVRYNSVFGYYIEITKANLERAAADKSAGKPGGLPDDYERKQTLVNAERFTTTELKEYETRILTAHERSIEIEKGIFAALRRQALNSAGRIRQAAAVVAETDLLACFAHLAALRRYRRPRLVDSAVFEAVAARHPVIETWLEESSGGARFIPNDLYLEAGLETAGPSLLLITGPNMGGKSTYLRQAAMLAILAQMGSFVPADSLRMGLVDRIYTRIGASDHVARGRSTFMVEMTETAAILNTATERSLILLDEMGRGTATFDGLSLAWATVEYLHAEIGARTLFATHYHELTMLAEKLPRARNLRVAVKETAKGIVFLHTIEPGAASKSYGIEVARLAGLPPVVLERARRILRRHESQERRNISAETAAETAEPMQMTMFTPLSQRIVDRIAETDVNSLTPLQALMLLEELQRELAATGMTGLTTSGARR